MTGLQMTRRDHLAALLWTFWFMLRVVAFIVLLPCLLLLALTQAL
jgi:hypothetical protein